MVVYSIRDRGIGLGGVFCIVFESFSIRFYVFFHAKRANEAITQLTYIQRITKIQQPFKQKYTCARAHAQKQKKKEEIKKRKIEIEKKKEYFLQMLTHLCHLAFARRRRSTHRTTKKLNRYLAVRPKK